MNQAKIWLVVKPTVGLPLLLGSVLVIAILVHLSVLSEARWVRDHNWHGTVPGGHANPAAVTAPAQ